MSFKGKVVLITGASSGIGAATAIKFAEEGAEVGLVGRNEEKLKNVAQKCRNPLVLVADVTKDEEAKRIVKETVTHFGKLDVLVNNAGIFRGASILQDDAINMFDYVMGINLRAPVLLSNLAAPHLIETKGNIINVSSVAAVRVLTDVAFCYCASKAGLDHFSRAIALDLASKGVRVNTVNPGPVHSDLLENTGACEAEIEGTLQFFKNMTALSRISEPEEVAHIILFLASEKAVGITGSSYFVDNGIVLKG